MKSKQEQNCLILGDTIYKTSGNITFSEEEGTRYFLAESPILENMSETLHSNLLENGMQILLKKIKS
jgi:hypothetical protein